MAPDDNSGARPAGPVVLRIKLRYDDVETMVQRFAPNVGKSGLFLPTRSLQPIGTEVKFELRLANDTPVLVGLGRVKHVKPQDPAAPKAAFGMAIELMRVSKEGRELIIKMIERRRAMGLVDVAIPVPEDVDAARRSEGGSQPRGDTSGIVRDALPNFASAPVAEAVLSPTPPASGPIAVAKAPAPIADVAPREPAKAERVEAAPREPAKAEQVEAANADEAKLAATDEAAPAKREATPPLLTSPRDSGPIPTQAVDTSSGRRAVASLAPERTRTTRPRVVDLIARASELSGAVAAAPVDGLDEQVDVERALVRARALAGGDLEAELAALREVAAAPLEISIEAASAELARQLGGKPIAKRSQSARWIAPPAVEMRTLTDPRPVARVDEAAAPSSVARVDEAAAPSSVARVDEAASPSSVARVDEAASPSSVESASAQAVEPNIAVAPTVEPSAAAAVEPIAVAPTVAPIAAAAVEPTVEAVLAEAAVEPIVAEPAPIATRPPRAERITTAPARDRFTRGRNRKAPEPPPAESLEDPPTVIPEGDPDVPVRDPHAAFDAKTRAATEASPSSVLAAVSALPTEPSVPSVPHDEEVSAAAGEPEYGFEEKTRIPTGDDLVHALQARERHSFSNIDEESLRTEPGQRPSSSLMIEDSADAAMLTRAIEGSQPAMRLSDADIEPLDDYGEHTQIGQMPAAPADNLADQLDRQLAAAEAEADDDFRELEAPQPAYQVNPYTHQHDSFVAPAEDPGEEISDFDVLAEADEADADLLSAHGEAEVAHVGVAVEPAHDDFAARLDLGDDDSAPALDDRHQHASPRRTKRASSEVSYTVAESVPQPAPLFTSRTADEDFDEPHGFANAKPTTPGSLRYSPAAHSEDLEDALAALDVDLDDSALEHQRRRHTASSQPRPLPGLPLHRPEDTGQTQAAAPRARVAPTVKPATVPSRPVKGATTPPPIPVGARKTHTTPPPLPVRQPPKRASTDEGVLIDFDDDE